MSTDSKRSIAWARRRRSFHSKCFATNRYFSKLQRADQLELNSGRKGSNNSCQQCRGVPDTFFTENTAEVEPFGMDKGDVMYPNKQQDLT